MGRNGSSLRAVDFVDPQAGFRRTETSKENCPSVQAGDPLSLQAVNDPSLDGYRVPMNEYDRSLIAILTQSQANSIFVSCPRHCLL